MKITLFGATGKTGKYLIHEGLKRDIELTVFARPYSTFEDSQLNVVRGALTDPSSLADAIRGADGVLSLLGPTSVQHPQDFPITMATEAIINAMKREGVSRLVAISTGTAIDPQDGADLSIWLPAQMIRFAMPNAYQDIIKLASTIRASELDWTMVRVGFLSNKSVTNTLNVGFYGHTKHSLSVSRVAVARFMFDQINNKKYAKMAPGISN